MTAAATHLIGDDLDDGWLVGDEGADAEILAGLDQRLAAEVLMDAHDERRPT